LSEQVPSPERRPTGIEGLDRILEGGFLISGVYIVQGPPGAGKTILANQTCFNHAAAGGRAVYVTLLAESHSRMFAHLRRMAFFDESVIPDRVYYIGGYSALEAEGLDALVTLIRGAIQKHKTTLLVVDGLISAQESSPTDREFKRFLHEIQTLADLTGCTVLLLTNAERASGFFPEHTMVDGVLHLTDELSELRPLRHIRILKLRGSAPVRGLHSLRITDQGLEVRPRIETRLPQPAVNQEELAAGPKLPFGLADLDEMLRGGVRPGSITMLLGSSGSGKTLLGMQFLSEGVRRGERVVYFGFYERPEAILAKCQRVGIGGLKEGVERGLARLVWHRPVEGVLDELGESLLQTILSVRPQRLFLDGMEGFERAADFPERMSHVYSGIAQELERLGITTLYSTETRELFARTIEVPINGLSAATQNIILLRHVEHRAAMLRVLAILKVRDDDYDARMRELRITNDGIRLLDTFAGEAGVAAGGGVSSEPRAKEDEAYPGVD
jgi:circadian clock protein KaiC